MKRIFTFALLFAFCISANAQAPIAKADVRPKSKASDTDAAKSVQPMNVEYTKSIIENTTDKQFLTELVDHLPASPSVPSPEKVLGYPVGTPNKLTYTKDQYRYYRELE